MILWLLGSGAAFALSCLPWTHRMAFAAASASEDTYIVVRGALIFDRSRLPKTDWQKQGATPQQTRIPARVNGKALTASGFTAPVALNVDLFVGCSGAWCASVGKTKDHLMFLKRTATGYHLSTDPCGGDVFSAPTAEALHEVEQCFNGAACAP